MDIEGWLCQSPASHEKTLPTSGIVSKFGSDVISYDVLLKSTIFFVKHIVEIAKKRISRSYEIAYPAQYR